MRCTKAAIRSMRRSVSLTETAKIFRQRHGRRRKLSSMKETCPSSVWGCTTMDMVLHPILTASGVGEWASSTSMDGRKRVIAKSTKKMTQKLTKQERRVHDYI